MIQAIQNDHGLTPEQRAGAIRALRERQKGERKAARRRVMDEEKASLKAVRELQRHITRGPEQGKDLH